MVKLNFLPHRLLAQQKRQQQFYLMLCVTLSAGAAGVAVANALLEQKISQQTSLVHLLQSEHGKLDIRLENLKALKQQALDLTQRRQQLITLLQQQHQTPELLQTLAQQTPSQINLRTLKQQENGITLSGNATSPEDVMQLLTNLHGGGECENGALRHAELQEFHVDPDKFSYRFVIHATTQPSAASASLDAP